MAAGAAIRYTSADLAAFGNRQGVSCHARFPAQIRGIVAVEQRGACCRASTAALPMASGQSAHHAAGSIDAGARDRGIATLAVYLAATAAMAAEARDAAASRHWSDNRNAMRVSDRSRSSRRSAEDRPTRACVHSELQSTHCFELNRGVPRCGGLVRRCRRRPVRSRLRAAGDRRPGLAVADRPAVALDDRQQADRRAREHRFVGGAQFIDRERRVDERHAQLRRQFLNDAQADAEQNVLGRRRHEAFAVAIDEHVGGRGFGDEAVLIEQDRPARRAARPRLADRPGRSASGCGTSARAATIAAESAARR